MIPRLRTGLALALAAIACASGSPAGPAVEGPQIRVLFIGNSLTYTNDLPGLIAAIGRATGDQRTFVHRTVAFPDYSLEDHWARGDALEAIDDGGWEYVVLQQGPSSLPESRAHLVEWAGRFGERIAAAGARPALYMVWPSEDRIVFFDDVRESYRAAAAEVDGVFVPAGEAWRVAWEEDPDLPLYSVDGFHPSLLGSVLAAAAFYDRLYGGLPAEMPTELPRPGGEPVRLSAELAALVRRAAVEAGTRYP